MEGFKQQVKAVQQCQSALRLPEEVVASLPICRTAQSLQQEASQLQHTTIQQCNILQVDGSAHSSTTSHLPRIKPKYKKYSGKKAVIMLNIKSLWENPEPSNFCISFFISSLVN